MLFTRHAPEVGEKCAGNSIESTVANGVDAPSGRPCSHRGPLACPCTETGWPSKKMGLDEGGLQPDLEGGDRTRLIVEGGFEMSERMFSRLLGSDLRRLALSV